MSEQRRGGAHEGRDGGEEKRKRDSTKQFRTTATESEKREESGTRGNQQEKFAHPTFDAPRVENTFCGTAWFAQGCVRYIFILFLPVV